MQGGGIEHADFKLLFDSTFRLLLFHIDGDRFDCHKIILEDIKKFSNH